MVEGLWHDEAVTRVEKKRNPIKALTESDDCLCHPTKIGKAPSN